MSSIDNKVVPVSVQAWPVRAIGVKLVFVALDEVYLVCREKRVPVLHLLCPPAPTHVIQFCFFACIWRGLRRYYTCNVRSSYKASGHGSSGTGAHLLPFRGRKHASSCGIKRRTNRSISKSIRVPCPWKGPCLHTSQRVRFLMQLNTFCLGLLHIKEVETE